MSHENFHPGDPAPWFYAPTTTNPNFAFQTVAGRYVVLCFFGSAAAEPAAVALRAVMGQRHLFDDDRVSFFGVSIDPRDQQDGRIQPLLPGIRFFWDFGTKVSRLYGAIGDAASSGADGFVYNPFWLVLDPQLRVMASGPLDRIGAMLRFVEGLPPVALHAGAEVPAPVLVLPRVFEPEFCRHLIGLYERNGGRESGFMREVDGKTVMLMDYNHKRRADYTIEDETVRQATRARVLRRVLPEIQKVFQFRVTRMERYIVACYDGETGGHFRAHRDNTTKGTAHRRFALSINLDAEAFEGGGVRFPEFGPQTYRAPTGGAVVFSCSLLHEVLPVTAGRRYVFVPFLYDDEGAQIREANNGFLADGIGEYRMDRAVGA